MVEFMTEENKLQFGKLFEKSLKKHNFNDVRELKDRKICIILYKEGKNYVGYLTGFINEEPFSNVGIGIVEAVYVLPSYRNEGKAQTMINEFENWAKDNNCKNFISGLDFKNKKTSTFFERLGYQNVGTQILFRKSIGVNN